jgi:SPP1 gp7 family putative phage head morphogenesis protein
VKAKTWQATRDARTRPEHAAMHGETVTVDETFSNGEDAPGEPNCRCTLLFELSDEILGKTA